MNKNFDNKKKPIDEQILKKRENILHCSHHSDYSLFFSKRFQLPKYC